jgi:phosphoglycolate phosphatase-like HAD superfamily hydrolase
VPDSPATSPPDGDLVPTLVVFDVDGVLADVRHRLHHVERKPKDWIAFFAAMDEDPLLSEGQVMARAAAADGHLVAYLTGRNEDHRAVTESWLSRHGLPEGELVMRRSEDRRPARVFKPQALRRLARSNRIVTVVDDDAAVVATLRREGWPVLHATWMDTGHVEQQSLFDAQEVDGRT